MTQNNEISKNNIREEEQSSTNETIIREFDNLGGGLLNWQRNALLLYAAGIFVAQPAIIGNSSNTNRHQNIVAIIFIANIVLMLTITVDYYNRRQKLVDDGATIPLRLDVLALSCLALIVLTLITWYYVAYP